VRSSTCSLIARRHSSAQHKQHPRIALDVNRRGKDARWIVTH
jgi:hypothetical protein